MEDSIEFIMTEFEGMRWCSEHELKRVCKELNSKIEYFKSENSRLRSALELIEQWCDRAKQRADEALKGEE
jgi:hypothetical protein